MKCLLLFLTLVVGMAFACYPEGDLDEDPIELFEQYIVRCGKTYLSDIDKSNRYNIFLTNLAEIKRRNQPLINQGIRPPNGLNRFADWSQSEFSGSYGAYNSKLQRIADGICLSSRSENFAGFSRQVNYQQQACMTPVQDQGNCTADYAFFTASNIADNYCLSAGEGCELSVQQSIDCAVNDGCLGGLWSTTAADVNWQPGLMREFDYPYEGKPGGCRFSKSLSIHQLVPWPIYPAKTEDEMRQVLDKRYTFVVAVDATNWQFVSGEGIIGEGDDVECCRTGESRYIQIVGYGVSETGTPYWLFKNVWGTGWGDNGLGRLVAGKNCYNFLRRFAYFPTKTEPGECTGPGPLPTRVTGSTTTGSTISSVTQTTQQTQSTTGSGSSCGYQCGKWKLILKILESINNSDQNCELPA